MCNVFYQEANFMPIIPAKISNADNMRNIPTESLKKNMPINMVPIAPIPVQTM